MSVYAIENQIGRLFHYFYENDAAGMAQLFTEDAVIHLPDLEKHVKGQGEIADFWKKAVDGRCKVPGEIHTVYLPCDIYLKEQKDGFYYGEWNTYSFRSEQKDQVQYFLTHMEADFKCDEGQWRFSRLVWNEILELVPWPLTNGSENAVPDHMKDFCNFQKNENSGVDGLSLQDYIAIRNLQGHFTHEGMDRKASWFCRGDETLLDLPSLYEHPACGFDEVKARIEDMRQRELDNDKNYLFLPMICAPVIVGNSDKARGIWLVITVEVKAQAFGIQKPPYKFLFSVGRFCQEFVKVEGKWQFMKFRHEIAFTTDTFDYEPEKMMRHRMREKTWDNTWLNGPEETGVACPESVSEIEMIMPQWMGRIRSGNSMDFVDQYMLNSVEEISMLVAGSTQRRTSGYENIKSRFGPREREPGKRRENPAYHTLASPVIEFSQDGKYASATWTDFAMADFSGAFNFPLEPVCYHMMANKYYHEFVRDNGQWKLYSFGWEPGIFFGGFPFEAEKCRGFYKGWDNTPSDFPVPGESYDYTGKKDEIPGSK